MQDYLRPMVDFLALKFGILIAKRSFNGKSISTNHACILHRNIHLTLTLKSLCMIRLKGDDEVFSIIAIEPSRPRTVRLCLLIYSLSSLFDLFMHKPFKVNVR